MTAIQLTAAGIPVFPCNAHKIPTVTGWQHPKPPDEYFWPTPFVGIPIPQGIFVIDLDTEKGVTRTAVDDLLGCALPWDTALLQTTPHGGHHYAFKAPEWPVKQGSNIAGLRGFDTRAAGRGFIATGPTYTPQGVGLLALAHPDHLPLLPESARSVLEAVASSTQRVDLPQDDPDVDTMISALTCIDPGDRDTWWKVGCGIHFIFHADSNTGFALFDAWSAGEYWSAGQPAGYNSSTQAAQWESMSPHRKGPIITAGTLFHLAKQAGWRAPCAFEAARAFGLDAAPIDTFDKLVDRINESGSDPKRTQEIITEIQQSGCDTIQIDLLRAQLVRGLKNGSLGDKSLLDNVRKQLTPSSSSPRPAAPTVTDMTASDIPPRFLGQPESSHGCNADAMVNEIFGDRIAVLGGALRWWTGSYWERVTDDVLDTLTFHALRPGKSTAQNVSGTKKALYALVGKRPDAARDQRIYFINGVLDLSQPHPVLTHHHRDNNNTGTLMVDYDPASTCPQWFNFINTIFGNSADGPDRASLLQEIIGWCLITDNLNVHKAIAFDGARRAGKGVILEILQSILGADTCGSVVFSNLADGKTQSVCASHNIVIDFEAKAPMRQTTPQVVGFLNKLTSNETVSIQLLHKQTPWSGRLNTKLIIACNGIPTMIDDSGASASRFLALKFTRSFDDFRQDRMLVKKLQAELSGIALWAMVGAQRLINNNGNFTLPATSIEASDDLSAANQPLNDFLAACFDIIPEGRCHTTDIWGAYKIWATDNNVRLPSRRSFIRSFNQSILGGMVERSQSIRINGLVNTGYTGLARKSVIQTVSSFTAVG